MSRYNLLVSSILLLCAISIAFAQDDQCPAIVQTALQTVADACADVGRNQLCYGNVNVVVTPRGEVNWTFDKTGDQVNVDEVQTVTLSPMNDADNLWGITLMRIQANLPDTLPGQNVTFLLFGDVSMTNNATDLTTTVPVTAARSINVRLRPTTGGNNVIASLPANQPVSAVGRLEDTSWLRVKLEDDPHGYGWVSAQLVQTDGDLSTLPVMQPDQSVFGPMQAFTFRNGLADSSCKEAPNSGILIQTPKGAGRITLQANDIDINLGSTAYVQSGDGFTTINLLEGSGIITAAGKTQVVPAGTFTRVPLGDDGLANGVPEFPKPYNLDDLNALPLSTGLPELIAITPPLDDSEIAGAIHKLSGGTTSASPSSPGSSAPMAPSAPGG